MNMGLGRPNHGPFLGNCILLPSFLLPSSFYPILQGRGEWILLSPYRMLSLSDLDFGGLPIDQISQMFQSSIFCKASHSHIPILIHSFIHSSTEVNFDMEGSLQRVTHLSAYKTLRCRQYTLIPLLNSVCLPGPLTPYNFLLKRSSLEYQIRNPFMC